jgi:pyruvate dehydrogenase E2 component (dihydrolipoamide acetyltransferase)
MATDVIMPQMGESIAEGTVTKWLKKLGDLVERDEPLFEISTDKVDAEIPSPAAGTLLEIIVPEGQTVGINTVVARIGAAAEAGAARPAAAAPPSPSPGTLSAAVSGAAARPAAGPVPPSAASPAPPPAARAAASAAPTPSAARAAVAATLPAPAPAAGAAGELSREERIRRLSSPVVRKIAAEQGVDITRVTGTGIHGRVTKEDILQYLERQKTAGASAQPMAAAGGATGALGAVAPAAGPAAAGVAPLAPPLSVSAAWIAQVGPNDRVEPMSVMRQRIADHMVFSKHTSPHVHTLYEVDMSRVEALRRAHKERFLESSGGAKLTYTVFMLKAVVDALRAVPLVNASVRGAEVIYHGDVNIGLAVSLEWGLIVPVIHRAQDLSMTGIAKAIGDLAARARAKKLRPEEVQGATFSVTNPGSYGGLIGMPVINQPNVAILGMGKVEKRVCVVDDMIAIRPKMYVSLGYDHRLVDGATAEQFLSTLTRSLEGFDETAL